MYYEYIEPKKNHELNDSRLAITQLSRAIANQSKEQLLIIGEPIGYFIASENTGADYTPLYTKHKFNNRIYDREILLSYQVYPETQYKLLSKVDSLNNESGTYQGLKCYERINTSASAQDK